MFNWLQIAAGAALGALVVSGPLYLIGSHNGRQQAAVDALETSVKILRERDQIDDTISAADAAALCADFGLSDADIGECVRRLAEASAEP
ncbi:MAG: hypothetical protein J0I98_06470 [Mesorhizobium sp.]|nr:hypothetical protein [Mesorhizobium sp.]MBN9242420.1 hypothetical protein [Mesorhizobium sp.]